VVYILKGMRIPGYADSFNIVQEKISVNMYPAFACRNTMETFSDGVATRALYYFEMIYLPAFISAYRMCTGKVNGTN
jgi:hypothetical protein